MEINCENCGHVVKFDQPSHLDIRNMSWEKYLKPLTAHALAAKHFDTCEGQVVVSRTEDSLVLGPKYRTLFVSAVRRRSLVDLLKEEQPSLQRDIEELFQKSVAPVLETVRENFKVLGCLSLPSAITLARTDLSQPVAAFCFVTVEDEPNMREKLQALGLPRLLDEGSVGTVESEPWDFFGQQIREFNVKVAETTGQDTETSTFVRAKIVLPGDIPAAVMDRMVERLANTWNDHFSSADDD